jgi:hypothetical protein
VRVVVDAPALSIGCAAVLALRAVAIGQPAALVGTRTLMGMFPVAFPYFGAWQRRRAGEHAEGGARDGDAGAAMSASLFEQPGSAQEELAAQTLTRALCQHCESSSLCRSSAAA